TPERRKHADGFGRVAHGQAGYNTVAAMVRKHELTRRVRAHRRRSVRTAATRRDRYELLVLADEEGDARCAQAGAHAAANSGQHRRVLFRGLTNLQQFTYGISSRVAPSAR